MFSDLIGWNQSNDFKIVVQSFSFWRSALNNVKHPSCVVGRQVEALLEDQKVPCYFLAEATWWKKMYDYLCGMQKAYNYFKFAEVCWYCFTTSTSPLPIHQWNTPSLAIMWVRWSSCSVRVRNLPLRIFGEWTPLLRNNWWPILIVWCFRCQY